jgi:hypothetical protein
MGTRLVPVIPESPIAATMLVPRQETPIKPQIQQANENEKQQEPIVDKTPSKEHNNFDAATLPSAQPAKPAGLFFFVHLVCFFYFIFFFLSSFGNTKSN